jgi:ribonuclease HI
MPWQKMLFRDASVWIHVGEDGRPVLDREGRAEMKYRESDTKSYRPGPTNLSPDPGGNAPRELPGVRPSGPKGPSSRSAAPSSKSVGVSTTARPIRDGDALEVWTDGACSGNPGPMGIGIVVIDGIWREEIGEYLGSGTNNIAELTAIERGLEAAAKRLATTSRRVQIHSDSAYAIGLLDKNWKAKANQDLVARIRRKVAAFPAAIEFVKVAGHAGVPENERCDELARVAVERRGPVR